MKTVAILQSNYIPWKGYFDLINLADEFILYDDVQYTRRDWRNRNRIKTPNGLQWLTIPVVVRGKYFQAIQDTEISSPHWASQHWKAIQHNYAHAPYFKQFGLEFEALYDQAKEIQKISQVNYTFLTYIAGLLNISTKISWSTDYELIEGKNERLVHLCKQAGATHYLSGPTAQAYLDETQFSEASISLSYMDYSGYPEYDQLYPPFEHAVSVLDLLFNMGPDASQYMKSFS